MSDAIKIEPKLRVAQALVRPKGLVPTRDGYEVLHVAEPGATVHLLRTGWAIVISPDMPPYCVDQNGQRRELSAAAIP